MKQVVIYHRADFDGIFCREIAKKFIPDAELIGWDYGDQTPSIPDDTDQLYMLDISVDALMGYPNLIWIDHHKSAIEKYLPDIPGYRIDGVAACRVAWQWFSMHEGLSSGSVPPLASKQGFVDRLVMEPIAVRLAGEYDIWDKRDPRAELFQHGLRSRELTEFDWNQMLSIHTPSVSEVEQWPDADYSKELLNPDGTTTPPIVYGLLENGKVLQYARTKENESVIKAAGFTVEFEGLKFLACNHARFNSHLFTAGLQPEHDACFGFCWDGQQWKVSLYHAPGKEHHDLSLIAVKHGGGGHRGACGFRSKSLPFLT